MNFVQKFARLENLNQNLLRVNYAMRGPILDHADRIQKEISSGTMKYNFDELVETNVGNPLAVGNSPISFYREVASCVINPDIMKYSPLPDGIKKRALHYQNLIKGNIGAYSHSSGYEFVRKSIANFIKLRDGVPSDPSNINITNGASSAIRVLLHSLIDGPDSGFMIPIPQYPLYSACITLFGGRLEGYYLDEDKGWEITTVELERAYKQSIDRGTKLKGLIVINPGNPTGQVLSEESMRKIVEFAYEKNLTIFADEVYQENIWSDQKQFHSFKKVIANMPQPYNQTSCFSFYSISKGAAGECGFRGGYVEFFNICKNVEAQLKKYMTLSICPNTLGQIMLDMAVNPPTLVESGEVAIQFYSQKTDILNLMKKKAAKATELFNDMKNIKTQPIEGAMYCFPRIKLSDKAIEEANRRGVQPDLMYTLEVLENTGLMLVEGSGFGQKEGTYHFRTTILVNPEEKFQEKLLSFKKFNDEFHDRF